MLGAYNLAGGPAGELSLSDTLHRLVAPSVPIVRGPLAICASESTVLSCSEVGGVCCVIDGALYASPGSDTRGSEPPADDAAAVAELYGRAGISGLNTLRGRYAAAIWSDATRKGVLVCDVLATHELFVLRTDGALIFATELPELLSLAPRRPGPDSEAVATWLASGLCPEGRTFYESVIRLGPGELIPLGAGFPEPQHYWRPHYHGTQSGTIEQHGCDLREQLVTAVGKRLSERSTAVILSGGVDSSVVTSVAARSKPTASTVRAYSAVFPGEEYDESARIRKVTDALGIDSSRLRIEPQGALWLALQYARRWQMPLLGPILLIDFAPVREAASDGAEVILEGHTGDELFGLTRYVIADHLRRAHLMTAVRLAGSLPAARRPTLRQRLWMLREAGLKGAVPYRLGRFVHQRRRSDDSGPACLLPVLRARQAELEDRWAWKRSSSGPLWWRSLADTLVSAPHRELRLTYLRQRAVSEGVVGDPPLYDVDLIEHSLRIPPELAFDPTFSRPVVREAMRGWLPEDVRLQTKKARFGDFAFRTMTGRDAPGLQDLLLAPDAEIYAYADRGWVREAWTQLLARQRTGGEQVTLWRMAAAECWLRAEADPGFAEEMLSRPHVVAPSVRRVESENPV
jgi:asparagine synthase (glutamine-hydrolysing)